MLRGCSSVLNPSGDVKVADARQRELMRGLARTPESAPDKERILSDLRRVLENVK
jgi:hypothetical protein